MSIWFKKNITLDELNALNTNTMAEFLEMNWEEIGTNYLRLSMPVSNKNKQPYGFLHGGASCVLAETIGSVASAIVIDREKFYCVGIEINANHVRSVTEGKVTAKCEPLHLGKTTHVWDIKIYDEGDKMFCVSRLTVAIIPIKK